ncbi:Hypothetical protein BN69_3007 [Methylocystis sp. SC2]|nr:Hypothetical protein BN69_3007 [Methylocystis sp. SC2]
MLWVGSNERRSRDGCASHFATESHFHCIAGLRRKKWERDLVLRSAWPMAFFVLLDACADLGFTEIGI